MLMQHYASFGTGLEKDFHLQLRHKKNLIHSRWHLDRGKSAETAIVHVWNWKPGKKYWFQKQDLCHSIANIWISTVDFTLGFIKKQAQTRSLQTCNFKNNYQLDCSYIRNLVLKCYLNAVNLQGSILGLKICIVFRYCNF